MFQYSPYLQKKLFKKKTLVIPWESCSDFKENLWLTDIDMGVKSYVLTYVENQW